MTPNMNSMPVNTGTRARSPVARPAKREADHAQDHQRRDEHVAEEFTVERFGYRNPEALGRHDGDTRQRAVTRERGGGAPVVGSQRQQGDVARARQQQRIDEAAEAGFAQSLGVGRGPRVRRRFDERRERGG